MIQFIYKDLERSEMAEDVVRKKLEETIQRFPDLVEHKIAVTLSMENSPRHAGVDVFGMKLRISGKKFSSVVLERKASNLYAAVADLNDALLERLNRASDKTRVKQRQKARAQKQASA